MADAFILRPATTAEDIVAVVDLCWSYRDYLLGLSERDRQITEAFYPVPKYTELMDDLATAHARPKGMILLARLPDGTPAGCGMSHELDDTTSEIKRVYVADIARRRGIAAALCQALVDQARADGFSRMVLDTSKSLTGAQRLYETLGFSRRGPYQPVPPGVLDHLVFFEAPL